VVVATETAVTTIALELSLTQRLLLLSARVAIIVVAAVVRSAKAQDDFQQPSDRRRSDKRWLFLFCYYKRLS
jgi:hypothetical protein